MQIARGLHSTEVAFLPLTQRPWVPILAFPKIYYHVNIIYQWHWLEKSGLIQRFGNVDRTHLALATLARITKKEVLIWVFGKAFSWGTA